MTTVQRGIINSQNIRQKFPEVYENLFSSCQVVTSSSDSFFWAGEYARFFGGLTILQKLPTKNLVGLEVLNEKKFCFADPLLGYNPGTVTFQRIPFDSAKEDRLLKFLSEYWPTMDPTGKIKGFKIHILSESHCGGGLGTTGVVLTCLAACLLILAGKVDIKDIEKLELLSTDELMNKEGSSKFNEIFRLAWRLTAVSRDGNSSGATSFGALLHTPYPILYFSDNINNYLTHPTINYPQNILENCQIIEKIPYWGHRMEEIFPFRTPQPWPIDIGRIYSGTLINTENIFKTLSKLKIDAEDLEETINKELTPKIQSNDLDIRALFHFDLKDNLKSSYHNYMDIFNFTTANLLLALRNLFTLGPNEENLRQFISAIHKKQDFNHFLGHSNSILDKICQRMTTSVSRTNEFRLAAAKIEGIGKGGHVLFIGPSGMLSEGIISETEKLAQDTDKEIYLDWASWIDGFGSSGLKVEQFLRDNKFSSFMTANCCKLTNIEYGKNSIRMIEPENLNKTYIKYDIVLVVPEHKIYINDKKLSSKEIPSAKSTITILKKIIDNPDHKINNELLGDTSYGQSRYDLQSKIFIPLDKALKKFAHKNLEYQIHGGIYDDYSVSLNLKNLKIALVENI